MMLLHSATSASVVGHRHHLLLFILGHSFLEASSCFAFPCMADNLCHHMLLLLLLLLFDCGRIHFGLHCLLMRHQLLLLSCHYLMLLLRILMLLIITCLLLHHLDILNMLCDMYVPQAEASVWYDWAQPLLAVGVLDELVLLRLLIIRIPLNDLWPSHDHAVFCGILLVLLLLVLFVLLKHMMMHGNRLPHFIDCATDTAILITLMLLLLFHLLLV